MKKSIFLFLALILPVAIFFFLKFFGKNKFDLPVLMQSAVEWPKDCLQPDSFPFHARSEYFNTRKPVILILDTLTAEAQQRLPLEIDTIFTEIQIITSANVYDGFPHCLSGDQNYGAILMDTVGQIRGIYKKLDRDETDRLILEVKILTEKY